LPDVAASRVQICLVLILIYFAAGLLHCIFDLVWRDASELLSELSHETVRALAREVIHELAEQRRADFCPCLSKFVLGRSIHETQSFRGRATLMRTNNADAMPCWPGLHPNTQPNKTALLKHDCAHARCPRSIQL